MIENAIQLAEEENADCRFQVMDAEKPIFADETFDVVISRNLTWTCRMRSMPTANGCVC